ncbi:MAG: hypothetical protein M1120_02970 [Patescibacteria group bacterium]|nr:hypothetical protein [Patescibacteria group bacterium]
MENSFPGQQTDERVLYHTRPHRGVKYLSFLKVLVLGFFVFFAFGIVSFNLPFLGGQMAALGSILSACLILFGMWWINSTHEKTDIFVTDRRIVKFAPVTPFHITMRTLFWDEAVKTKTYYKNPVMERILGVGSLEIHARSQDKDNVDLNHLPFHQDLANYIDKILFTFKNKPDDLKNFKEFVAKPKGQRE